MKKMMIMAIVFASITFVANYAFACPCPTPC